MQVNFAQLVPGAGRSGRCVGAMRRAAARVKDAFKCSVRHSLTAGVCKYTVVGVCVAGACACEVLMANEMFGIELRVRVYYPASEDDEPGGCEKHQN